MTYELYPALHKAVNLNWVFGRSWKLCNNLFSGEIRSCGISMLVHCMKKPQFATNTTVMTVSSILKHQSQH